VGGTLLRCCSFSFGSICLGSLFIGPTNFLRRIADKIRPNKEEAAIQSFVFLQELIVTAIDWLNTKFSSWAFVYVGKFVLSNKYIYVNVTFDISHQLG
jgi:hypothetical protein